MYKEVREIIPRQYRSHLSGIRNYAASALHYDENRKKILDNNEKSLEEKRTEIDSIKIEVNNLSLILFIYSLYLNFQQGDRMIKDTVNTFESLEIPIVKIGSLELSKTSRYYDMGENLSRFLISTIVSPELLELFKNNSPFHEIVSWYRNLG